MDEELVCTGFEGDTLDGELSTRNGTSITVIRAGLAVTSIGCGVGHIEVEPWRTSYTGVRITSRTLLALWQILTCHTLPIADNIASGTI